MGGAAVAQEAAPQEAQRGNGLPGALIRDYTEPRLQSLDRSGQTLEDLVRDGKILLTEEDAVRIALENNLDLSVERYSPYFSFWGIEKGRAVMNPVVSFNTNVNRLVTPAANLLQGGETLLNLNTLYDVTFHKPFEQGLDVDLNFNTRRLRSNNFFTSLNPSLTPTLSVNVTQHLLKDFGKVSRGRFVKIARNSFGMSQEDFASKAMDVVTTVLNTYWDLVYSDEDIRVKEASRKLAELVLEQNRIQVDVGAMAPLDVVQAEAEVATRDEQLVVSRYNRRLADEQLKKLLSPRVDAASIPFPIEPASKPALPASPPSDPDQAVQRALEIRPEVKRQRLDIENRKIQVDYARNQLRPTLDVVAGYSQNGLGGNRVIRDTSGGFFGAPVVAIEPGGFFDSLDSLFSRKYLGYTVGFNFRVPIGNDEARANSAQAQIEYRQGQERLRSVRQRIALEVRQAYDALEMNQARVKAAEATVRYSDRKLQGEQDKYSLGASTTRFILEAQRDLEDARSRLLRAQIDLIKSRVAVDRAVGDTLGAHNMELSDALPSFK
jgi:outer membrane protein TolC